MEKLLQLWNEWEIHLLVLMSFTVQMFLFFAGSLRPRNTNTFVRLSIWIAYLGADFVAVYALGFLSRQQDNTTGKGTLGKSHQLAFFWAPFLLIHLGGQDTITAFAIEDNNLWLRHLLNLAVHVMLASYVFWKSTGWHNLQLLVPGIFLFVSGIIKYGERTYALKLGSLKNTEGLPARGKEMQHPELNRDDKYATLIGFALRSAPVVRNFFAGCNLVQFMATNVDYMCMFGELDEREMLLKIEIGMIYGDLYSKAMVLRKRICVIFRCLSQVCAVVAFVLFTVSISKHRYGAADVVVTYVLFVGGFLVELCAVAVFISSPWTWGWLESRKCHKLARMCWFLLSSNFNRLEKRMLWPNSMGQYNIMNYVGLEHSWLSKHLKTLVRVVANMFGAGKERLLWISKLLDSKTIQMDKEIMQIVTLYVDGVHTEFVSNGSGSRPHHQVWPNLHPVLRKLQMLSMDDFGLLIVFMHALTEVHLRTYKDPPGNMDAALVGTCRKLSNYMLYLLVGHPEMLPVTGSVETTLEYFVTKAMEYGEGGKDDVILQGTRKLLEDLMDLQAIQPNEETLQEIRDFWLRLLLYAAGKSRGETHAAQLAVGGELLTYAWLLMAHLEMGDSWPLRIELGDATAGTMTMMPDTTYVFPKKSEGHHNT